MCACVRGRGEGERERGGEREREGERGRERERDKTWLYKGGEIRKGNNRVIGRQKTAVQKWRVERPEDRNTEVVEKREEKTVVRVLGDRKSVV